jgi:hypothetical protein
MKLFAREDEFTLSHGGNTVRLRASLRAAIRLERLHDGFAPLLLKITEFDTVTVRAVILTAATDQRAGEAFLGHMSAKPMSLLQEVTLGPLVSLCAAFLPDEQEDTGKTASTPIKRMTWAETYAELFRMGTGWLGWTPAATWHATPYEIIEAVAGHVAKLKALNGSSDPDQEDPTNEGQCAANIAAGLDPDFDRAGLHAMKSKTHA